MVRKNCGSKSLYSGATARSAGCAGMALSSAVLPLYEMPTAPTAPSDHGCEVIHSVTSPMSATSASDHSTGRWPDDAPLPRASTRTRA